MRSTSTSAVGTTVSHRFEAPLDRAVLDVFAESVRESGSGTVLDAGCGPGRVAAYLAERGLDARGVITTPPCDRAPIWAEVGRVLDGDGWVLVAFQAGKGEPFTRPDAYGSTTALTLYRHCVDEVGVSLRTCGFDVRAQVQREPCFAHETTPQTFLLVERSDPER